MKVLELVNMTREKNALIQHINRTLETLTREDLSELNLLVWKEMERRDKIDISTGTVKLTKEEIQLVFEKKQIDALKSVRLRTRLSLLFCKNLVEYYSNHMIWADDVLTQPLGN